MPLVAALPPGQLISPLPIAPPVPGINNIVPFNRTPVDEPSLSTVKPSDIAQYPNDLDFPRPPSLFQPNLIKQVSISAAKVAVLSQFHIDDVPNPKSDAPSFNKVKNGKKYTAYEIIWNTTHTEVDRHGQSYPVIAHQSQIVWGPITGYTESKIPQVNYFSSDVGNIRYGPVIFCGGPWSPEQTHRPFGNPGFIWAWGYDEYKPLIPINNIKIDIVDIRRIDGFVEDDDFTRFCGSINLTR